MSNELLIYMDDSGKLNKNENCCIYGGLFFYNKSDYINFINKYKSIIKDLQLKYYNKTNVEIKGTTKLKSKDTRRIYNLLKKQNLFGVFIDNHSLYNFIINDKASRGRYIDYAQKRIIKKIMITLIKEHILNINKDIKLNIKIDQSKTKSNGYYNLRDSIYEELVNGISNFDYNSVLKPILNKDLIINIRYYNSKYNYGIQASDFIAHLLHKNYEEKIKYQKEIKNILNYINVVLFLPKEKEK